MLVLYIRIQSSNDGHVWSGELGRLKNSQSQQQGSNGSSATASCRVSILILGSRYPEQQLQQHIWSGELGRHEIWPEPAVSNVKVLDWSTSFIRVEEALEAVVLGGNSAKACVSRDYHPSNSSLADWGAVSSFRFTSVSQSKQRVCCQDSQPEQVNNCWEEPIRRG